MKKYWTRWWQSPDFDGCSRQKQRRFITVRRFWSKRDDRGYARGGSLLRWSYGNLRYYSAPWCNEWFLSAIVKLHPRLLSALAKQIRPLLTRRYWCRSKIQENIHAIKYPPKRVVESSTREVLRLENSEKLETWRKRSWSVSIDEENRASISRSEESRESTVRKRLVRQVYTKFKAFATDDLGCRFRRQPANFLQGQHDYYCIPAEWFLRNRGSLGRGSFESCTLFRELAILYRATLFYPISFEFPWKSFPLLVCS